MKTYRVGFFLPDFVMEFGRIRKLWRYHQRELSAPSKKEALLLADKIVKDYFQAVYEDLEVFTKNGHWRSVDRVERS